MSNWTPDQYRDWMTRRLASEQRARERMQNHASESIKRRNPEFFNGDMGSVATRRPERNKVSALDGGGKERRQRKGSVVILVSIIALRRRLLDEDSAIFAAKPLRDAIAASLGLDDEDARIAWQYSQQITRGEQGVIVRIEALSDKHIGMAARV